MAFRPSPRHGMNAKTICSLLLFDATFVHSFVSIRVVCSRSHSVCMKPHHTDHDGEFMEGRLSRNYFDSSMDYSERIPSRPHLTLDETNFLDDWGIGQYAVEPHFPDTVESVAQAAFEAIAGTLYGKQRLDPNVASNAMTRSIFGYRPVRYPKNVGRIGVEIDGASYLFPSTKRPGNADATRRIALLIARKLSEKPWLDFEEGVSNDKIGSRPVAVYFNTVKQALVASQELQMLMREEIATGKGTVEQTEERFEKISIQSVGQEDAEIPEDMHRPRGYRGVFKGKVDPTRGIVLVVQPTDYSPAVGAVSSLQRLVARAGVQELPTVVLSPRFLATSDHGGSAGSGWEQSGYQQSAIFGGAEPPKGPTPWLMRDFSPPVFCWVGNALSNRPGRGVHNHRGSNMEHSRVALTQSVMDEGHSWHMFAAEEKANHKKHTKKSSLYKYLASTKTSSGRPTRNIIRTVYDQYHEA